LREKSLRMTSYLKYLIDNVLAKEPYCFSIVTPREDMRRGGHVAVEHDEALRIGEALRSRGVIPDFRPPNILRIAPVPLYNRYHEVWQVVQHLKEIINKKEYVRYPSTRKAIP